MSKGLEALHHPRIELAKIDISAEGKHDIAYMPFYKTNQYTAIEKELKEYESYKTFIDNVKNGSIVFTPKDTWEEERKKLKALEIIKRIVKIVDYSDHTIANGNLIILQGGEIKTQEEYDLLKEVLL